MIGTISGTPQPDMREEWATVNGVKVHYVTAGAGPAMILLHGQGENWATWQHVIPELARTHRVYAIDLPGAAQSGKLASAVTPPSYYSDFLAAFLDELELSRVALVGSSHGGLIALRFVLAAQERVTALCLADSAALGRETHPLLVMLALPFVGETISLWCTTPWGASQWTWMLASIAFSRPHRIPLSWYSNAFRLARQQGHIMGGVVAPVRGQLGLTGQREVLLDLLVQLEIPTLVVWGEDDQVVPSRHGTAAARHLRRGRMVLIPECGHLPQVERPAEFVAALSTFLQDDVINAVAEPSSSTSTR
ncbi:MULTISPECIES: alpha/beta fold hydrolase [Noviherbaspirillum]|uniref:Alpha/beta fold hydrolase n=1 Tax=Noviherbaspirillum album TaxID=3080276 RepID=A0ABU6JGS4_9BURK|nr:MULTISPECIES: alpha/beta fold hydrolase [Noviherbaspirillum]MEC4722872.1 alpha/beta fold hydrolase [Noviherbaspirillum sp. CPCC 100848]